MGMAARQLGVLVMAAGAALLASACCVGPLLLVMAGAGGTWVGSLHVLEPYQPYFLGVAGMAMVLAFQQIYRPQSGCLPGASCALPRTRIIHKILFWLVSLWLLLTLGFPHIAHYFY